MNPNDGRFFYLTPKTIEKKKNDRHNFKTNNKKSGEIEKGTKKPTLALSIMLCFIGIYSM